MTVDGSLDPQRAQHLVRIAQALYTFWDSGDVRWLREAVDFIAFDVQHAGGDRIFEDWHLEDNLTFLTQARHCYRRPRVNHTRVAAGGS